MTATMQTCSNCGNKCRATLNMCPHCTPKAGENPHEFASRKAKYSHKCWIVWRENDQSIAAPATPATLERAIAAVGPEGRFSGYSRSTGQGNILRASGVAQAWLANARAGYLNW